MTLLTHRGDGPAFSYAGNPMHILAGHSGQPPGFAAMEITIPARFAGPVPHAHDEFDEAIYVLSVNGHGEIRLGGLVFSGLAATSFPGWWPRVLPAGRGLGGQRDHPLAGEGLGEPVGVALC